VRFTPLLIIALLAPVPATADDPAGIDVRLPLVEQALRFVRTRALDPPPDADLLRAGAIRVCGGDLSAPGCAAPGLEAPQTDDKSPRAAMAWRQVLESALAAQTIRQGDGFDKTAFERFVIDAMVAALDDPSSFYIAPAVYRQIASIPSGFAGFGLNVIPQASCLKVAAVHHGSPASQAGFRGNERIVQVNGSPVTGYHRPAALAAIWGASGEQIELAVERSSGTTQSIRVSYQDWTFTPFDVTRSGDVARVRIRYFAPGLAQAVARELAGSTGVVIDLRRATGGHEDEMSALADLLLGDAPIGSKVMRDDLGNRVWSATADSAGERTDIEVALVVGPGTCGLAEVLAAALRHGQRAILLGVRTAGQGTLETLRPFNDGSAIQVTSTQLLGPAAEPIDAGVLPHLETKRVGVIDLAVTILDLSPGPGLDQLIAAAHAALAQP
jgi:C-terminal peptidase prc